MNYDYGKAPRRVFVGWSLLAKCVASVSLAALLTVASAQDAYEQLKRIVDEQLLSQPAELGFVQVVDLSDGSRWTRIYLVFDDLRPRPRKTAEDAGWQTNEAVAILISRDFKTVLICRRDLVEGC